MPKFAIPLVVVLLGVVGLWWWSGSDELSVPDTATTPATETVTESPAPATPAEPASEPERNEVATTTGLRGRVVPPNGSSWSGDGQVALYPEIGDGQGMMGLLSSASRVGRDGVDELRDWFSTEPVAKAPIQLDGTFVIEAPRGRYELHLEHEKLMFAEPVEVDVVADLVVDLGDLESVFGAGVLVLVSDFAGQPVPGADVQIGRRLDVTDFMTPEGLGQLPYLLRQMRPREQLTDELGVCRFSCLDTQETPWTLRVRAPGFVEDSREVVAALGQDNVVRVALSPGARIRVSVLDEGGRATSGVQVQVRFPGISRLLPITYGGTEGERRDLQYGLVTGEDGSAERGGLPSGEAIVSLQAPGYRKVSESVVVALGEVVTATLRLERGAFFRGRVVDEAGEPIAGAAVSDSPLIGQTVMGMDVSSVVGLDILALSTLERGVECDADGKYVLGGFDESQPAKLIAAARGYEPATAEGIAGDVLDFTLRESLAVSGTVVLEPDGAPVRDFKVTVSRSMMMLVDRPIAVEDVEGSEDGSFRVDALPRERLGLLIETPGRAPLRRRVDLRERSLDLGELRLDLPSAVAGVTVDQHGQPVSGVSLRVARGGPADAMAMFFGSGDVAVSDAEGKFRIDGLTGRAVRLIADKAGFAPTRTRAIRLTKGETTSDVTLELAPGGSIRGKIINENGDPLFGWKIQVAHATGGQAKMVSTDDKGEFLVDGLAAGTHKVDAFPLSYVEQFASVGFHSALERGIPTGFANMIGDALKMVVSDRVVVRDGAETELTLVCDSADYQSDDGLTIEGRVTIGGQPLADGMMLLIPAGSEAPRHITHLTDGAFRVAGVRPGPYSARVQSDLFTGFVGARKRVEVRADGQRLDLDLPGGSLSGIVRYYDTGEPAPGVVLSLMRPGTSESGAERFDVGEGNELSAEDGSFRFEGLARGTFEIFAKELMLDSGDPRCGRLSHIDLGVNERREGVVVHIGRGSGVRVAVRDAIGARPNALVLLLDPAGRPLDLFHRSLTNGQGVAAIQGVPPGRYRVAVDAPAAAPKVSDLFTVEPGAESEVDVLLTRGSPVELELSGAPVAELGGEVIRYAVFDASGALVRSDRLVVPADGSPTPYRVVPLGDFEPGSYSLKAEGPRLGHVEVTGRVGTSGVSSWKIAL